MWAVGGWRVATLGAARRQDAAPPAVASLSPSGPPGGGRVAHARTSGNSSLEKTMRRQVLPQAPSPTTTSFLRSGEAIFCGRVGEEAGAGAGAW